MNGHLKQITSRAGCSLLLLGTIVFPGIPCEAQDQLTNAATKWPSREETTARWGGSARVDIEKAASNGDVSAQYYLGRLNLSRSGTNNNLGEARKWISLAAGQGYPEAMLALGQLCRFGAGGPKDLIAAERWFKDAVAKGEPNGEYQLGLLYDEEEMSPERAVPLFRRAAEQGVAGAMTALYLAHQTGRGVPRNPQEARKWLVKGAEAGSAYAQCLLGATYATRVWEKGTNGALIRLLPPNMPEAVRWYRKAADQNWPGAQYHLGLSYLGGEGVEQDEERGLELVRAAADQHQAYAMVELARLYARGVGQPRGESDRPIRLLERVATSDSQDLGETGKNAYDSLVFRHEYGIGTPRDIIVAVEWYCRAAHFGIDGFDTRDKLHFDAEKKRVLGVYRDGAERGTMHFPAGDESSDRFCSALSLYLNAACNQEPDALVRIGTMYLTGEDVPRDPAKAWIWFTLAGQRGASGAIAARARALLTEDELSDARRLLPELTNNLNKVAAAIPHGAR